MVRFLRKVVHMLLLIAVVAFVVLVAFRVKYHDAIRQLSETQVRNSTSDLINDAIDRQIET